MGDRLTTETLEELRRLEPLENLDEKHTDARRTMRKRLINLRDPDLKDTYYEALTLAEHEAMRRERNRLHFPALLNAADENARLREALRKIRSTHAGYIIRKREDYESACESMNNEIRRMDKLARTALNPEKVS